MGVLFLSSTTTGIYHGMSFAMADISPPHTVISAHVVRQTGDPRIMWSGAGNKQRAEYGSNALKAYWNGTNLIYFENPASTTYAVRTIAVVSAPDGKTRVAKDGVMVIGETGADANVKIAGPFILGTYALPANLYGAYMRLHCVAIYNRALSESEILAAHKALVRYYGSNLTNTSGL